MATFAVSRDEPVFRAEDCSPFDIGLVYSTIARFSATNRATRGLLEQNKGSSIGDGRRRQVTNEQSDSITTINIILFFVAAGDGRSC